jgi:hypothetical protein
MSRDHPATVEPFNSYPAKAGWLIKGVKGSQYQKNQVWNEVEDQKDNFKQPEE